MKKRLGKLSLFLIVISLCLTVSADVVKPALVEISVYTDEKVQIEIRTSLEALLSGINGRFANTVESPNSEVYDRLRNLSAESLNNEFSGFKKRFLSSVALSGDTRLVDLSISKIKIPSPGYTKVPRTSIIVLEGILPRETQALIWYFPNRFSDQVVRVRQVDIDAQKWHLSPHQWIREDRPSEPFSLMEVFTKPTFFKVMQTYIEAGFVHILPKGFDHILFILGIFLASVSLKTLLVQVSMFTIAHSITLSLGVLGWVNLPAQIVEPMIALSIAYIAVENIYSEQMSRFRLPVIFGFGLIHGLGFASVLAEFGLPADLYVWALIWFNVGVEFGQIAIFLAAYVCIAVWFRYSRPYRRMVVIPGSIVISLIGMYWFFERLEFVAS